jgi:hypothetical protein
MRKRTINRANRTNRTNRSRSRSRSRSRTRKLYKGGVSVKSLTHKARVHSEGDTRAQTSDDGGIFGFFPQPSSGETLRAQRNAARLKRRLQEPQDPEFVASAPPPEFVASAPPMEFVASAPPMELVASAPPMEFVASAPPLSDDAENMYDEIGWTPHNPAGIEIPDTTTPRHDAPSASSFQVIGYNQHPMFHVNVDEATLMTDSDKNGKLRGEDYAVVNAHGAIGDELSPNMKFIANKYLRIVELGKAGQVVTIYPSMSVEVNKIMRDPNNYAMFDNTTEGEERRAEVFQKLCPYTGLGCTTTFNDGLNLVDITHERLFSGHVHDEAIPDEHKITHNTFGHMLSTGVFVPVDYTKDRTTPYLANKRLFKRYPGTSFLSKQTTMHLVKTMLPIAIRENRRINLLVLSCAVIETQGDDVYDNLQESKPGTKNPAIEMLTLSKRYMATLNKLLEDFMLEFMDHDYVYLLGNITENASPYKILDIAQRAKAFYQKYFQAFESLFYTNIGRVEEAFSFSVPGSRVRSNELLNEDNAAKIKTSWFGKYLDELIKVKIYLIREFVNLFAVRVRMIKHSLDKSKAIIEMFMARFAPNTETHTLLNAAVQDMTAVQQYIDRVFDLIIYMLPVKAGWSAPANSFTKYKKYVDVARVYQETKAHELYDRLTEDMDYDRYERDETGKMTLKNPLPPGNFRKTARFMHKYRELPNFDEAFERARKTRRKKQPKQDKRITLSV